MEVLSLSEEPTRCIESAQHVLAQGGVILYPTDTIYGLGADACNESAVSKIYEIKHPFEAKHMLAIVADMEMTCRYAVVTDAVEALADAYLPGPLSFVVPKRPDCELIIRLDTAGFRIPNHDFCLSLAKSYGRAFTSTSANISGQPVRASVPEILHDLGEYADMIDLVIDAGTLPPSLPSTVVGLEKDGSITVYREGAISAEQINQTLKEFRASSD